MAYWPDTGTGTPTDPGTTAVIDALRQYFTDGGAGVAPSVPGAEWFNMITDEVLAVLAEAGIAPSKADHGQLAKAIQATAFGAYPVGAPIPWPLATPPAGFLMMQGQSFSAATYPKLALAYPGLVLPDMRAEFIRGWDNGRGVDTGRTLLSHQGDAMRNVLGTIGNVAGGMADVDNTGAFIRQTISPTTLAITGVSHGFATYSFDASRVVPTASENRPGNIVFNYIAKAA